MIDSGSTDETINILRTYSQVEVFHHAFVDFASQCNFGISQVMTPWVLSLDADYELSDELVTSCRRSCRSRQPRAIGQNLSIGSTDDRYEARFIQPRTVLYRKDQRHLPK